MADQSTSSRALPAGQAVVVIGAGTMGSGIAEVASSAGHHVYLRDTSEAALEKGMVQIRRSLDKRVERGRLDTPQRDAIIARLQAVNTQDTQDQKEGMRAFLEERPANYQRR